jgi:uncharacterized phage-associated protein
MTYSAPLIAHAFVKKGLETGKPVTQMKLQKMVYFAHGYHLAKFGEPLIREDFEAWQFGPVVPSIYNEFRLHGSDPILVDAPGKLEPELRTLSPEAQDAINYTWDATKDVSAYKLSGWTHKKDSPWAAAYRPLAIGSVIPNHDIQTYFTQFLSTNGQAASH